ncbi:5-methylcytosine-specific restriction endonuclease system specificity protein McrC [Fusobacterium sp. PH5-44]|uniref:5-methylcytosine-specific restriction endonuclease system specificity protein McrC n=1 Tax=unclassified Fusobacterium TaxID=2648384 RepID=UPI003D20A81F
MVRTENIKISNIYYMLSYAFRILSKKDYEKIGMENFDNIYDMLGEILSLGVTSQIKKGLHKEYLSYTEATSMPRGKINISRSIKENYLIKMELICSYDIFFENSMLNQILKTTMYLLIKSSELNKKRVNTLKRLLMYLGNVNILSVYNIRWNNVRFHKNNKNYEMLMNVCYMIITGLIQNESSGEKKLHNFIDDQRMSSLYEKFVLEYYKRHYGYLSPSASHISWDLYAGNASFLPRMKSDIMLKYKEKTLIIDTKYYKKIYQTHFEKESYRSSNLYQIYTYVKNHDKDRKGSVSGMLLYAKTNDEEVIKGDYSMGGNKISIRALDLAKNFDEIKRQLNEIADEFVENESTEN